MTLDDLERRNNPYFAFFSSISISLLAKYVAVVEYRPILSVNIVSQFQALTFGHKAILQYGLSAIAIAELLVRILFRLHLCVLDYLLRLLCGEINCMVDFKYCLI